MSSFGRAWCWPAAVAGLTATVLPWPASGVGAGLSAAEVGRAVVADRGFGLVPTWLGLLVLGPVVAGGLLLVASAVRRLRWLLLALAGTALAGGDAVAYGLGRSIVRLQGRGH